MSFLNVNFETIESTLKSFDRIADKFSKDVYLKINNSCYRLVDFEFYTFSKIFPDPHTYKNELQLQTGQFYVHGSGVDITFGDGINYGGILIRSIVKLYDGSEQEYGFMKRQIDGPQKVATELFSNLNSLISNEKNDIKIVDLKGHNQDACFYPALKTIKSKRIGLTTKPSDSDNYFMNLPLRYITLIPKFKFVLKIKGIEAILKESVLDGKIELEEVKKILGYKLTI
ncbi:MAG: hypothetical protein ACOVQE_09885 [Chitinophagaceae bacterium]